MKYQVERPLQGEEACKEHDALINSLCGWLNAHREQVLAHRKAGDRDALPHGDFGAVFGGRGSGKSSVLAGLTHKLREEGHFTVLSPFEPERLPEEAELVSALVLHLEGREAGGTQANQRADTCQARSLGFADAKLWDVLAERRAPKDFQKIDEQLATSVKNYRERLVDGYQRHGGLHRRLRDELAGWIDGAARCRSSGAKVQPKHFVLLIDDIDLVHYRAWDLLDCLHHCFHHPLLSIIVFADEPLLLEGLTSGLLRADKNLDPRRARSLASAMALKLLPARFAIASLTPAQRRARLIELGVEQRDDPPFAALWEYGGAPVLDAVESLERILPDNSRQLKALRNRWVLKEVRNVEPAGDTVQAYRLGFLLEAIELQHPGLGLLWLASQHYEEWLRGLAAFTGVASAEQQTYEEDQQRDVERRPAAADTKRSTETVLATLVEGLPVDERTDLRRKLAELRRLNNAVATQDQRRLRRAAGALLHLKWYEPRGAESTIEPSGAFGRYSVIDLTAFRSDGGRALLTTSNPDAARDLDRQLADAAELTALQAPSITVLSAAPTSVHLYLGWRLRRFPVRRFINQSDGRWEHFLGNLQGAGGERGPLLWRESRADLASNGQRVGGDIAVLFSFRPQSPPSLEQLPAEVLTGCAAAIIAVSAQPQVPPAPEDMPDDPWRPDVQQSARQQSGYADAMVFPRLLWQARDLLVAFRQRYPDGTLHICMDAPAPFAFFLGGHLHTLQPIQLYEFESGRYVPSLRMEHGGDDPAELSAAPTATPPRGDGGDEWGAPVSTPRFVEGGDSSERAGLIATRRGLDEE